MSAGAASGAAPALRALALGLLVVVGLGFAWHLAVVGFAVPAYLVPRPLAVLGSFVANARVIAAQAALTLGSAAAGLALSTLVAVALAGAFTMRPRLAQATMPVVVAFRSAPVAAVAPIVMLFLGRGIGTSVVVVTVVSFFPLLVNVMRGMRAADRNATELLRVYDASRFQELAYVRMPYALPFFFTGLRIAGASAILGAMLSEWITGSRGLGNLILDSGEMREIELLWAAVLTSIALALAVFAATSAGERRLVTWRR